MFEDNFQSYFGESDSNFFGDTSDDMIFGEGYGEQGVNGAQFFSEAAGFSSDGGEFISEATAFDTMNGEFFTEGTDVPVEKSSKTSTTLLAPENTTDYEGLHKRGPRFDEQRKMWAERLVKSSTPTHPESERAKRFAERESLEETGNKRMWGIGSAKSKFRRGKTDKRYLDDEDRSSSDNNETRTYKK